MSVVRDELQIDDAFVEAVIAGSPIAEKKCVGVVTVLGMVSREIAKGCAHRAQSKPFIRKLKCDVSREFQNLHNFAAEYTWKIECTRERQGFGVCGEDKRHVNIFFCESVLHEHDHFDNNDAVVYHFGSEEVPLRHLRLIHSQLKVLLAGVVAEFGRDTKLVETLKILKSFAPKQV